MVGRKPKSTTAPASNGQGAVIPRVLPNPNGNRAERRAAEKEARKKK